MTHRTARPLIALLVASVLVAAAACSGSSAGGAAPPAAGGGTTPGSGRAAAAPPAFVPELTPVKAVRGEGAGGNQPLQGDKGSNDRPHFEDAKGREVLLRGVNLNSFGDYFQADPNLPATVPVTDQDWDSMAALGFSAVRFIVSWSALEPTRGSYDQAYIDKVRTGIEKAGARGIYVVVDMHQDAWGKYIASPPGHTCSADSEPAIGWDGAPEWATATGVETCRSKGARELSEAVGTSFRNFYDDKDGVRTALANAWGHLAGRLADEPAVIGYDLFNEPNGAEALAEQEPKYEAFLTDTIAAIRKAEAAAEIEPRIAFVEPIVLWPLPNTAPKVGFTSDPQIAFAPHNYFESISKLLKLEQGFGAGTEYAKQLGAPLWTGEYGWWDDGPENMERLRRYAKAEDATITGGAWWQWRQACGDPHSLNNPERKTGDQLHLNGSGCPGDRDKGVTKTYALVLSRAYPRAAPGFVTSIRSDPDARTLDLAGRTAAGGTGQLVVWVPDNGRGQPTVKTSGLRDVATHPVPGGSYVTATAGSDGCAYWLGIDGPDRPPPPAGAC